MKHETGAVIKEATLKKYKTGSWKAFRPIWDKNKCTQCLICYNFCPENCIPVQNGKRIKTDLNYCKGCLICEQVCPVKAITHKKV